MRGFRASRAMQNFKASHFGKPSHLKLINGGHNSQDTQNVQAKQELPAWLRLPKEAQPVKQTPAIKKASPKAAVKTGTKARAKPKAAAAPATRKRKAA